MEFQVGVFHTYQATRDIRLGAIENFQFNTGDQFSYDGVTLKLADGRTFDMPQLRQSIIRGWFVLAGGTGGYSTQSAQIQVSGTESQGYEKQSKTVLTVRESDEAEVGSVAARRENREMRERQAFADPAAPKTPFFQGGNPPAQRQAPLDADLRDVVDVLDGHYEKWAAENGVALPVAPANTARLPVSQADAPRPSMPVVADTSENTGTFVARIEREQDVQMNVAPARPADPAPLSRSTFSGAGAQVFAENRDMGSIVTSSGDKPSIQMGAAASVSPSSSTPIHMADKAQVGTAGRPKTAQTVLLTDGSEGVAVGRVLSPTKTSFTADPTNTSASAIDRAQGGSTLKVERFEVAREGSSLEEIMPDAASSGTPQVEKKNPDEEKLQMIRMLIPDFKWDKDRPTMARVKEALKFVKKPEYMRAILMYETETAASEIKKAMAKALK